MKTWQKVLTVVGLGPVGVIVIGIDSCIELNKQLDEFCEENQRIKTMLDNNTFPRKACSIDSKIK